MDEEKEAEQILKTIRLLKLFKEEGGSGVEVDISHQTSQSKLNLYLVAAPIIFTIIAAIYFTGIQSNKWTDGGKILKSELRSEFVVGLTDQRRDYEDKIRELSDELNEVKDENDDLKTEIESLKKIKDKVEYNERTLNELYRITTWLRSQHGVNQPPD